MKVKAKKTKKAGKVTGPRSMEDRKGHTIGIQSGTGVSETWNGLFRANVKKKLPDDVLLKKMKKEFPKRKEFQPVGRVRSFFNRGVQGYGNPPGSNIRGTAKESFAYDAKGNRTASTDWGFDRKPDPAASKIAAKRAAKQWAAAKKGGGKKKVKKASKKAAAKKIKLKIKKAA